MFYMQANRCVDTGWCLQVFVSACMCLLAVCAAVDLLKIYQGGVMRKENTFITFF